MSFNGCEIVRCAAMGKSQVIAVRKRPFSVVPDDLLTNANLSWGARVVLAWMVGRSPDFELYIWYVRKVFRLSETQWVRYRRQMQREGYFHQRREKDTSGKFRWVNIVSDTPEFSQSAHEPTKQAEPSHRDGGDGKPSGGTASNGEAGDKPALPPTNLSNTKQKQQQASVREDLADARKKKRRVIHGIVCWDNDDVAEVARLILEYGEESTQAAVSALHAKGNEPLPSRVQRVLEADARRTAHAKQRQIDRKVESDRMAERVASDPRAIEAGKRMFENVRLKRASRD